MDNILEVIGVSKHYTGHKALDDVSISIAPGTVYGLLGPNGAGKTTLFNMITGVYSPTEGEVFLNGEPIAGKLPYESPAKGLPVPSRISGSLGI